MTTTTPAAPTMLIRFFLMLRSLGVFTACLSKATGGKMPADHETIRIWGLTGGSTQNDFYLFREVLGGDLVTGLRRHAEWLRRLPPDVLRRYQPEPGPAEDEVTACS